MAKRKNSMTLEGVIKKLTSIEKELKSATGKKKIKLGYQKNGLKYRARKAGLKIPKDISKRIEQPQLSGFAKVDSAPQIMDLTLEKIMARLNEKPIEEMTVEEWTAGLLKILNKKAK